MTTTLLAEFPDLDSLRVALDQVGHDGHRPLEAFTPYPVEGLDIPLGIGPSRIRIAMLVGGLAAAGFAFALQYHSAVFDYPINSGGRPLNSWPVFFLVPFEVGIFSAALAGILAFLWACRLPRLHDPLFAIPGFERATQDRFFLLASAHDQENTSLALRHLLEKAGALVVTEVRQP